MDNEFWLDIGATEYDRYDDQQAVLNELYPPEPERESIQLDLITFEDIPF